MLRIACRAARGAEPADGAAVRGTVVHGGLRVVTERVPGVRSVAFGAWVRVGSRHEPAGLRGASHFLEHLLFKGTRRRAANEVAAALDRVGGEFNAVTAKEYTCYYVRVRDRDLPMAVDLVADMLTSALLDPAQVEAERRIILAELAGHAADPRQLVQNLFARAMFGDHPLARPAAGDEDSILRLSRDSIAAFYASRYRPCQVILAAAGAVDHDRVAELAHAYVPASATADGAAPGTVTVPPAGGRTLVRPYAGGQAHIMLGVPGVGFSDPRRYAVTVLGTAVGAGFSSRLYQEIRERRALAYTVGSNVISYADTGTFSAYGACDPDRAAELVDRFREQFALLARHGLAPDEVARAKEQVAGRLVLGQEDMLSRAGRLGQWELYDREPPPLRDVLARIGAVTVDDVRAAAQLLAAPATLAVVGPYEPDRRF